MLKSYFLTAYRNLTRNKEYSIINILGLTVSIASCLLLFYVVSYELSFDTFHANKKNIYRVVTETKYPEGMDYGEGVPTSLPEAMRTDFAQLKVATILSIPNSQIDVLNEQQALEKNRFRESRGVFFAEPQFFDLFSFGWLHGSPNSLQEPNTAVLTRETAEKYFGNWKSAIGKTIQYRNNTLLKVTGILQNIPVNSDFPLKVVISFKTQGQEEPSWTDITSRRQCYVLPGEHTSIAQLQNLIPAFEKKHHPAESNIRTHYTFQPLKEIHFDERYGNFNNRMSSKMTLLSLSMIGLFLIIAASINFVNLATAQVIKKSKEVGVRKVLGGSRGQLYLQFYGETFLLLFISSMLAFGLAEAVLPFLQPYLNLPESFNPVRPLEVIIFLAVISIVITVLSGFYPARVLGSFKPIQALKSKISNQTIGGISLRRGLVAVQFLIAQVLVIITLVVLLQFDFFQSAPLGFDKNSVVIVSIPADSLSRTKIESVRSTLLQQPQIKNVSFSFTAPLSGTNRRVNVRFDNSAQEAPFEVNLKYADVEYFKIYDLPVIAGHVYSSGDTAREYVVNEMFLKKLGVQNAADGLGKVITIGNRSLPIVGVVKDFHLLSLQQEIEPLIMMCNKNEYRNMGIKLEMRSTDNAIAGIKKVYATFFPDNIFEYRFLDDNIARQYQEEARLSFLTKIFAGIAIGISCLGLYGLISFMTVQRRKEVAVRKVLGAGVWNILLLFYKEFILLVVVAFFISTPVSWYFMSDWLNGFAYRINLSPWIFIIAIALSFIIAVATISIKTLKASLANPAKSLRTE